MIRTVLAKLKRRLERNQFLNYGEKSYIHYSTRIKNPIYIYIGDNVYIGAHGVIEAWDEYNEQSYKPRVNIGDGTLINDYCHIGAIREVTIGKECLFGSHVMVIDHSHGRNIADECSIHPARRDLYSKGTVIIGDRVWIGENAVILPDVIIGDEAVIGAGAVVTKSIPARCVAAGNPAKVIRIIASDGDTDNR